MTELILGLLVTAAVTAVIVFWQYELYQENLAVKARLLLADNPEEEVFQILKEDGDLTAEEVQDVLGDYGYEHVRDSLEGQRFPEKLRMDSRRRCGSLSWIWGSCFLRKTQAQEGD